MINLCFKPAQFFLMWGRPECSLLFSQIIYVSESSPWWHFLTPGFAYSTCGTSWLKLEPLSSPGRQGNFSPIFFEFFSCSSHTSFPFLSLHGYFPYPAFSFPHTFSVKQFPSPCQAQGFWSQNTLLWQMPFNVLEMHCNHCIPKSIIKLFWLDFRVYCPQL